MTFTSSLSDPQPELDDVDPFDLAALRLDPAEELIRIRKVLVSVRVRKPKRQEFVRVRPEVEYRLDAAILDMEEDGDSFMVLAEASSRIGGRAKRSSPGRWA